MENLDGKCDTREQMFGGRKSAPVKRGRNRHKSHTPQQQRQLKKKNEEEDKKWKLEMK